MFHTCDDINWASRNPDRARAVELAGIVAEPRAGCDEIARHNEETREMNKYRRRYTI